MKMNASETVTDTLLHRPYLLRQERQQDELKIVSVSFKYTERLPVTKWVDVVLINTSDDTLTDVVSVRAIGGHPAGGPIDYKGEPHLLANTLSPLDHCVETLPLWLDFVLVFLDVEFKRNGVTKNLRLEVAEYPDKDDWDSHGVYNLLDYKSPLDNSDTKVIATDAALPTVLRTAAMKPELLKGTSPAQFEKVIAQLFREYGFTVEVVAKTGDGGVDILAVHNNALSPTRHIVQCKRYASNVGVTFVRELYGVKTDLKVNRAILVSSSGFTAKAREFADRNAWEISLVDFVKLKDLMAPMRRMD